MAPGSGPRILLATTSERGQCGVFLATSEALQRDFPGAELHFASFSVLEKEVCAIADNAVRENPLTRPMTFHTVAGKTHTEAFIPKAAAKFGYSNEYYIPSLARPLSLSTSMEAIRDICSSLIGWDGPEFMQIYHSFDRIIKAVNPDAIILDFMFSPAVSAAWNSGVRFSYLAPNAILNFALSAQPQLGMLWKYPTLMSGFNYPVPWHQKAINVFLIFYTICQLATDPTFAATKKYVERETGKPMRCLIDNGKTLPDNVKIFIGSLPELDYPGLACPARVVACGPIVSEAKPLSSVDPDFLSWLANAPTIYVNLGSLRKLPESEAVELAKSLNRVLDELDHRRPGDNPRSQVLWKLNTFCGNESASLDREIRASFNGKMEAGRIHIVDWLKADPISILKSGNIICSIHHGGASSYNEAILAGVPHVVLPSWTDCYEYANKVEVLGIGRKGCRAHQPAFNVAELSTEILEVLVGMDSAKMKMKALELANICAKNGHGAEVAARSIAQLAVESAAVKFESSP